MLFGSYSEMSRGFGRCCSSASTGVPVANNPAPPAINPRRLKWSIMPLFSFKKVVQLDEKNDDDQRLQHERAPLVKLADHGLIQVGRGLEFLIHQVTVVGHADPGRGETIRTRVKHVAQELDGVVDPLGQ